MSLILDISIVIIEFIALTIILTMLLNSKSFLFYLFWGHLYHF